jgi:hypothetical protein
MKGIIHLAVTFVFGVSSAAVVAYALAHVAHYNLAIPSSALREQALTCAVLMIGLVTIECLSSKE